METFPALLAICAGNSPYTVSLGSVLDWVTLCAPLVFMIPISKLFRHTIISAVDILLDISWAIDVDTWVNKYLYIFIQISLSRAPGYQWRDDIISNCPSRTHLVTKISLPAYSHGPWHYYYNDFTTRGNIWNQCVQVIIHHTMNSWNLWA